ncbi:MAG: YbjN domain-containing protein [Fimbriimonadaceae bacterium]|nr:YbjN domain-containing protein [Fimbriimonadaceae bacterium]
MPISSQTICQWLDAAKLSYAVSPDQSYLMLPFAGVTEMVRVIEEGEAVVFQITNLHSLTTGPRRAACMEFMLDHNYRTKIGTFSVDNSDNEVRLEAFLAVEDTTCTAKMIERYIRVLASEARTAVAQLRGVEAGQSIAEVVGGEPGSTPPTEFEVGGLPAAPVEEQVWLEQVHAAFSAQCANVELTDRVETMRDTVWPALQTLRSASVQAGREYLTPTLAADLGLTAAEEYVVLFMLARQANGDRKINFNELDRVYSRGAQSGEGAAVASRLTSLEVLEAVDHDDTEPFRLTRRYLDPLTARLPFTHRPWKALLREADLPAEAVSEVAWLAAVRQVVEIDLADPGDLAVVAMVHEEVWPALQRLRKKSLVAGQAFQTAQRVAELELSAAEELLVAYIGARAVTEDSRVWLRSIDEVHSPGLDKSAAEAVITRLLALNVLRCCDDDGQEPYTLGSAGAAWRPS